MKTCIYRLKKGCHKYSICDNLNNIIITSDDIRKIFFDIIKTQLLIRKRTYGR